MRTAVLAILLAGAGVYAQVNNPTIIPVTVAPSGSCSAGLPNQQVTSTGTMYTCQNVSGSTGTWGAVTGGAWPGYPSAGITTSTGAGWDTPIKLGTLTDAKWCSYSTANGFTCTQNAPQVAGTYVTAVSVATANGVSGSSSGGATPALTLTLGAITPTSTNGVSAATMAFLDASSSVQTQLNGKQATLTNPVTGVASPTAGLLTKWGASGNAIVDGLKFGTMTDTKWCVYSTASGIVCNTDTPAGSFTAGGDLSGTSSSQTVAGIQSHAIAAPTTAGYVHWTGAAFEYANPSGSGTVNSGTANHLSYYASSTAAVSSDATATDDGTTLIYTGTGGVSAPIFTSTGATPGAHSLVAGAGSIPALPANSAGFAAPATGGTAFLYKLPATAVAGILHAATPGTADGVNESALTASAVDLAADVTGKLPIGSVGSAGLSGTSPVGVAATGAVSCATCVTSAASLTSGAIMTGAGTQASQTNTTGTGVVTALGVNTGTAGAFAVLIASGATAMPTGALAGNACSASATTATATGAATSDAMAVTYASDPTGVTGYGGGTSGGISIRYWLTANTANFKLCNETAGSITPGALSINWRVTR